MNATGLRSAGWWLLTGVFVCATVLGLALGVGHSGVDLNNPSLPFLVHGLVGAFVARRRPDNPIGWVFLAVGALAGLSTLAYPLVAGIEPGGTPDTIELAGMWLASACWIPMLVLATTVTSLVFPDGLLSRRWRPALWVATVATTAFTMWVTLWPTLSVDVEDTTLEVANPLSPFPVASADAALESTWWPFAELAIVAGLLLAALAAVVSTAMRYRRSEGVERAQMRWFTLAVSLLAAWIASYIIANSVWGLPPAFGDFFFFGAMSLIAFIPVSCGIAILRYGLYEIDQIISRTVSYVTVTMLVVGTYAVVVTSVSRLLPDSSKLAVAGATLAAAAVFRPVLRGVQDRVDRRFNRARFDAVHEVDAFAARLRDSVDPQAASADLVDVVQRTVAPAAVGVWVVGAR